MKYNRIISLAVITLGVLSLHLSQARPSFAFNFGGGFLPGTNDQKMISGSYSNSFGSRNYYLYVPHNYDGTAKLPVMVMLHGCFQAPLDFARETGMNTVAEKYGFAVLYPEQTFQDNIWKCWNWFKPVNQARLSGEPSIIIGMLDDIKKHIQLDSGKIFAAGLSAGAAMASNIVACHSDIFAGAGIHSGLEYRAAVTESEAHQVVKTGPTQDVNQSGVAAAKCSGTAGRTVALVVFHGKNDPYVNPINSDRIIQQFSKMNDILDDGQDNDSQNSTVIATHSDKVSGGYSYTTELFGGSGSVHLEKVIVEGMGHAWSGAAVQGQYADPRGPNASEMMWVFLSNYAVKR